MHLRPLLPALLLLAVAPSPASSVGVYLLADLEETGAPLTYPSPISSPPAAFYGSNPSQFLAAGERAWFVADDRIHGAELWSTDGSADGTELAVDLCPGECSGAPELLGILDGALIFRGTTLETGREIWRTDGTPEGTTLLVDACPGPCDSESIVELQWMRPFEPADAARAGGVLYFPLHSPGEGREMWSTDGTPAGTRLVHDTCPGTCSGILRNYDLRTVGQRVLVGADDDLHGIEPWAFSDDGGELLADLCVGTRNSTNVWKIVRAGARLVFAAACDSSTSFLYSSDGTPSGTFVIADMPADQQASWLWDGVRLEDGRAVLSVLFPFSATPNQLWISDGTPTGTAPLAEDVPDSFEELVSFGDGAALIGRDGSLWTSDGTVAGTTVRVPQGVRHIGAAGGSLIYSLLVAGESSTLYRIDSLDAPAESLGHLEVGPTVEPRIEAVAVGPGVVLGGWRDPLQGSEPWIFDRDSDQECGSGRTDVLCLLDDRFEATVSWTDPGTGNHGPGMAVPATSSSGHFWFFDEGNLEMTLKILDGTGINDHYWLFTGAVSDVEVEIRVRDRLTGDIGTWIKEPGDLCGIADLEAFPEVGSLPVPSTSPRAADLQSTIPGPRVSDRALDDDSMLPLQDGRFEVRVRWLDPGTGNEGVAQALRLADNEKTGAFWFFSEDNLELLVKVLDGRPINGSWWLLWGGLTNLAVDLEVRDLETDTTKSYERPAGSLCGAAVIDEFPDDVPDPDDALSPTGPSHAS